MTVPASDGAYRLTTSVKRAAALTTACSRVAATWTFRLDSTVAAGRTGAYPVTVTRSVVTVKNPARGPLVADFGDGRSSMWLNCGTAVSRVTVKGGPGPRSRVRWAGCPAHR